MITSKQLNRLRDEAYATACNKGFHDEKKSDEHYLMLVITEIAEAVQADRKGLRADREAFDKYALAGLDFVENFERQIKNSVEDELADIVIRLLDYCGMIGINLRRYLPIEMYFVHDLTYFMWCLCRDVLDRNVELVVWSVIEYCDRHGIDILWHIERKMEYNRTRPRMHNAKY